jgi:hypothetical protein
MFTVVIPTMWKPDTFEEQLNSLCCSEYVDEIILINNDKDITPNFDILNNKKILHVKPPENIIVNPSWNLGVYLSNNNNICLLNDDIIFDMNVFKFMSCHLDKHICGLNVYSESEYFELIEVNKRMHGFGCMMFIRKDLYDYIPESIKLFHGDDYIFISNNLKDGKNYFIEGCSNNQVWGVTSKNGVFCHNTNLSNIIHNEEKSFKRIINEKSNILHAK